MWMHVHIYAHTLIFMSCGCTHDMNHAYKHPEMHVYIHNAYTCMTLHIGILQTGTYVCAHTVHKIMQQGTLNTHHTHRHPAHTSTLHAHLQQTHGGPNTNVFTHKVYHTYMYMHTCIHQHRAPMHKYAHICRHPDMLTCTHMADMH